MQPRIAADGRQRAHRVQPAIGAEQAGKPGQSMLAAFFDVSCETVTPSRAQPARGFRLQAVVQTLGVDRQPAKAFTEKKPLAADRDFPAGERIARQAQEVTLVAYDLPSLPAASQGQQHQGAGHQEGLPRRQHQQRGLRQAD